MTTFYRVKITQEMYLPATDRASARHQADLMITDEVILRSEHEMNPPTVSVALQGFELGEDEEASYIGRVTEAPVEPRQIEIAEQIEAGTYEGDLPSGEWVCRSCDSVFEYLQQAQNAGQHKRWCERPQLYMRTREEEITDSRPWSHDGEVVPNQAAIQIEEEAYHTLACQKQWESGKCICMGEELRDRALEMGVQNDPE